MLNAEALEKFSEKTVPPQLIKIVGKDDTRADILMVPKGFEARGVKDLLDAYKTKPDRRSGVATAVDIDTVIALANRFKSEHSALFQKATISDNTLTASLTAVLNYHPAGEDNKSADHRDHRVVYNFPLSEELKTWLDANKKPFDQREFAEFLENNIADLCLGDPASKITDFSNLDGVSFATPGAIMTLARGIEVRVDEKVVQAFRTNDGSLNIQYTAENKDAHGQPLNIPEWFCLNIPVFQNGARYQFPMRLRFRVAQGRVTWSFDMYRKNDVLNQAFDEDCTKAAMETGLPLYNGSPE